MSRASHRREQHRGAEVVVRGVKRQVIEIDAEADDRCLVADCVDSFQRSVVGVPIPDVAAQKLRARIDDRLDLMRRRVNGIEHDDGMALIEQLRNHRAADEPGTAGDEYAHCFIKPQLRAFCARFAS